MNSRSPKMPQRRSRRRRPRKSREPARDDPLDGLARRLVGAEKRRLRRIDSLRVRGLIRTAGECTSRRQGDRSDRHRHADAQELHERDPHAGALDHPRSRDVGCRGHEPRRSRVFEGERPPVGVQRRSAAPRRPTTVVVNGMLSTTADPAAESHVMPSSSAVRSPPVTEPSASAIRSILLVSSRAPTITNRPMKKKSVGPRPQGLLDRLAGHTYRERPCAKKARMVSTSTGRLRQLARVLDRAARDRPARGRRWATASSPVTPTAPQVHQEVEEGELGRPGDEDVRWISDQRRGSAEVRGDDLDDHERQRPRPETA